MTEDTIFDKILRREIPADIVHEDDTVLAFRDINPQGPTHVVVIPKIKAAGFDRLTDLSPEETGRYMHGIARTAEKLGLAQGYRVVFNIGKHGQQTVSYVHAHIIGGRQMGWPPG
jgi:histidine triad (HIT) family protein